MTKKDKKKKILDALEEVRNFEVVWTNETTYAVNVKAKSKEEAKEMWEKGDIDWDSNDITDEDYLENSLEIYEDDER